MPPVFGRKNGPIQNAEKISVTMTAEMLIGGWGLHATGRKRTANGLLAVLALVPLANIVYIVGVLLMTRDMH